MYIVIHYMFQQSGVIHFALRLPNKNMNWPSQNLNKNYMADWSSIRGQDFYRKGNPQKLSKLWKNNPSMVYGLFMERVFRVYFWHNRGSLIGLVARNNQHETEVLRFSKWTKDFNIYSTRQTQSQVWIKLLEQPQEYWRDHTLLEIVGEIITPLLIKFAKKK